MIETTLGALVTAKPALDRLAQQTLPVKTAYRLAKLVKHVTDEAQTFETQRAAWIRELGAPTGDGDQIAVKPEHVADYLGRVQELAQERVTVDGEPVRLDGVTELTAADIVALGPFVTEPT